MGQLIDAAHVKRAVATLKNENAARRTSIRVCIVDA